MINDNRNNEDVELVQKLSFAGSALKGVMCQLIVSPYRIRRRKRKDCELVIRVCRYRELVYWNKYHALRTDDQSTFEGPGSDRDVEETVGQLE